MAKVLEFQLGVFSFSFSPSNEYSGLSSFRMDWLDLLTVKRPSRVFSNTTVQKYQFFSAQLSLSSNSHIYTWLLETPWLFFSFFLCIYFNWRLITLYCCGGICHTFTWISHRCTCVPHPDPPSHLLPHPISQGHPSAPALSALSHASNLDWRSISHMVIYMFQCYSLKSSHPRLLPQSPKVCSLHLCLFCCLAYRVIVTILLNCIYMC